MVDLVLENSGQITLYLEAHWTALFVQALYSDLFAAGYLADITGDREAAFVADLLSPPLDDFGVEQDVGLGWLVIFFILRKAAW